MIWRTLPNSNDAVVKKEGLRDGYAAVKRDPGGENVLFVQSR